MQNISFYILVLQLKLHPLTGPTTRSCNFLALIALFNNDQVVLRNCFYVSFLLLLLLLSSSVVIYLFIYLFIHLFICLLIRLFIYLIFLKFNFEII